MTLWLYHIYYTAPIINRHSEGVAIKEGFEYLKTIVACYELLTPGQMNGNETSSSLLSTYTIFIWSFLKISGIYMLSANFELFAYFSENTIPRFKKKIVDATTQVEKLAESI